MGPHFSEAELACKCGCGFLPQQSAVDRLELLRGSCGFPLPITSAARCPKHNSAVSSTGETGPHTTGRAFDISVSGDKAFILIKKALELGYTGIGVSQRGPHEKRFIHVDDLLLGRPRIWSY